jgi:hypothetical protein
MNLTMIKFLPENIKDHILSYHCRPQPNYLLTDITNFVESKKELERIYYDYFCNYMVEFNLPLEDKYWIINDLIRFLNQNVPTMLFYHDLFYEVFERNIYLFTKKKTNFIDKLYRLGNCMISNTEMKKKIIDKYIKILDDKDIMTQINIFWGLMRWHERNEMVNLAFSNKNTYTF